MKILSAPWRVNYSDNPNHPSRKDDAAEHECVFCIQPKENTDEKNLIVKRFKHAYVMLNKYPYNAGHLLILPFDHKKTLHELSKETRAELMELTSIAAQTIKNVLHADGVNIGINMGKGAGAGIPSHLHIHVLPRWIDDTNFMPTLADTKVISFDIEKIYEKLKKAFEAISIS